MLQEFIQEHAGDITKLLGSNYGLSGNQASNATGAITSAVSGFLEKHLGSGNADFSHLLDLFNKDTPNTTNSLFSGLSNSVENALGLKTDLGKDTISKISSEGLNDILGIFQHGKIGNMDLSTLSSMIGELTGKGGGIGSMIGGLFGGNKS